MTPKMMKKTPKKAIVLRRRSVDSVTGLFCEFSILVLV